MDEITHLRSLDSHAELPPLYDHVCATRDAAGQEAYEAAARATFDALDHLDQRLGGQRYLGGEAPAAADWAHYVVLLRFELVYYELYKLNLRRIRDFESLGPYLLDLHQQAPDADLLQIRRDAYAADVRRNPKGTVSLGLPDLWAPHGRARFSEDLRQAGTQEAQTGGRRGEFVRGVSAHRRVVGRDLPAEGGRYHLIVANNCPWCHRAALTRSIKGLDDVITMDLLYYRRDPEQGWQFRPDLDGFEADSLYGVRWVEDLYRRVGSSEKSVPILWDKVEETVVNNESAEIIRMMDEAWPDHGPRLAPADQLPQIDEANAWIWRDINNGAYKAGFSSNQTTYERAFRAFFAGFDRLDQLFEKQRWVCGDEVTEADVRLFPTVFRFDPVYYLRMRLNQKMVREYRNLSRWLADFWALPGVPGASNLEHCRLGYFGRTADNLIPIGPTPRFLPEST